MRDLKIYSYSTTHSITIHKQAINDRCTPVPFRKKEKGMAARFGMEEIDGDCKMSKLLLHTGTTVESMTCGRPIRREAAGVRVRRRRQRRRPAREEGLKRTAHGKHDGMAAVGSACG